MSDRQDEAAPSVENPPRRRWVRTLAYSASALVLLYVGFIFAVSRFLDPQALAAWIEPRLENVLSRDVDLGAAEVGILPLRVELRDLVVSDPTGLTPSLARVGTLKLQVAILPLLRRDVLIRRLTLEGVEADLHVGSDGRTNFGDLSTESGQDPGPTGGAEADPEGGQGDAGKQASGERPFSLNLETIGVSDSRIAYSNERDSLFATLEGVRLRASLQNEVDRWLLEGSSTGDLSFRRGGGDPLMDRVSTGLTFDLSTDTGFENLEVRTGELALGDLNLDLQGSVQGLRDPVRTLALTLVGDGIPLPDLLSLLPDTVRQKLPLGAEGVLAADLEVNGGLGPGRIPEISGGVRVAQGSLSLEGKALAEGLNADLTVEPDRSIRTRIGARVLGGPLSLTGTITLGEGGGMDLTLQADSRLDGLASVVSMPDGVTSSGRIETNVRVVGPLGRLEDLRMNGDLAAAQLRFTHPSLGVPISMTERGQIHLEGISATFQDLPLEVGEDRVSITGTVHDLLALLDPDATPRIEGGLRGPRLDLTKLSANPQPDTALTYGRIAFAKVGGRTVKGLSAQDAARELKLSRPESLPFAGNLVVDLDTVIDRQGRMEQVRATVDFGPDFLRVTDATFLRYGGEIRTSANVSLGSDPAAPFSVNLQVRNLDAGAFLSKTTPLGRWATGRIAVNLDVVGTLDGLLLPDRPALVGSGSFSLTGGGLTSSPLTQALATYLGLESLRNPTVRDWGTSFLLENGRVTLAEATLNGAPGTPKVGGSVGLDGGLDLRSIFDIPTERLSTAALERLGVVGEVAANVASRPDVVQAILRIGGSVFDPSLQAEPRAMAETLGQAVKEEAEAEVRRQIEAQKQEAQRLIDQQKQQLQERASGFLRNLTQRRDTMPTPRPPDTVPATPLRPDTILADTLRPDTTRPDTVRPDTTRPDTVQPDTVRPDTTRPDTVQPDTVRPDVTGPGAVQPGTLRPAVVRPGTTSRTNLTEARPSQLTPAVASSNPTSNARTLARIVRTAFR